MYFFSNSFRLELENEFFKIIFTHGIIYKITWYKQDIEVPAYALVCCTLFNLWIEKVYIDLEKLSLTNYKKEDSADHTREKFDNSVSEMEKKTNKIHKKINLNCFGNNTWNSNFVLKVKSNNVLKWMTDKQLFLFQFQTDILNHLLHIFSFLTSRYVY